MRRTIAAFLTFVSISAAGLVTATPAAAQFEYCNLTSFYLFTALGVERPNGTIRTEGSWLVRPGECREVESNALNGEIYYTYAESHPAHEGGIRVWGGRTEMCTGTSRAEYSIETHDSCFARNLEPRNFSRVEVGEETFWRANLTEPDDYQQETARHAAVQRLLNDVGYNAGAVDGYLGRRTRRSITSFADDHGIESDDIVSNQLLDELVAQASEMRELTGYQFCNRTDIELWAAMGYTEESAWHTRGWWSLDPGTCTKAINDALPADLIYTYAVGYRDNGDVIEFGGDHPLCTGDQAFEIQGNEDCESRGYITVGFERIETEGQDGWRQEFVLENINLPPQAGE